MVITFEHTDLCIVGEKSRLYVPPDVLMPIMLI